MPTLFDDMLSEVGDRDVSPYTFAIEAEGIKKPIQLHLWSSSYVTIKSESALHLVILTHGAGGTALSAASARLAEGIASASSESTPIAVLAFDGSMNLKARVKAFLAVIEYAASASRVKTISLAGRSMGCRAAAIASATSGNAKLSGKLVLESYPLIGKGEEARKQVLIDLPSTADILFIIGSQDEMCPVPALELVRTADLKSDSKAMVVDDMDHGMQVAAGTSVHPCTKKQVAEYMGKAVGKIAGEWLLGRDSVPQTVNWRDYGISPSEKQELDEPKRSPPKRERNSPETAAEVEPRRRSKRSKG